MKKILIGVLTAVFLCGNAEAATMADLIASKEAVSLSSIKKVDVGGEWGYILTMSNGQRQYVEYPTLQKQIEMIDKQMDTLKAKRAATVKLMEECINAK